ncbi:MAG TPA: methyltransferase domain-containing protein [Pyrinomonadaceae bacterium]|nr:methyltransferase domain-containing protein [Pyrinomonadaceae bacterium]
MNLAYFSPFNPQPSGISDYSEELLPYLAAHAEIDLFVDGFVPSNQELLDRFRCFDYHANPESLDLLPNYDAIVYHMGNDHRYHTGIVRVMRQHPGVVVFHDYALQDFFLGQAREQGAMSSYLDELEACNGKSERTKAEEFVRRGATPPHAAAPLNFPLNANLARTAEGIIVHSEWSRERLSSVAPGLTIAQINHHITPRAAAGGPDKRGENDGPVQIASFGLITPDKGIERALSALSALRDEFDFHYTLVGPAGNFPELPQLIERYHLSDRVTVTGHVSLTEFEDRIAHTDIAINLRERPVGATSGSLCRIMAAGVPAVVSNVGAFAELPNSTVVKVEPDQYCDPMLQAYLSELIQNPRLRRQIGRNARRHVLANHRIEASAAAYVEFIGKVIARRPRRRLVKSVASELSHLGLQSNNDALLRRVAGELAVLAPALETTGDTNGRAETVKFSSSAVEGNGHSCPSPSPATHAGETSGRLPGIEGVDYKRAAIEYLGKLSEERSHHLRTKPFYNLANKPAKYKGEGMDEDTHRHLCDFANLAVTLALPAGAKILDVGCGSGWLSEYFARLGYRVKGIDISPELIAMSQDRVARVPFGVDHETPLRCDFAVHDIELGPLDEKFDAIICYDSLHHFADERSVMRNLAAMIDAGGLLFILEGQKPGDDSLSAEELRDVMREFGTLESPFSNNYLRALISENGFAVVGDYVSVNGLFEREMLEGKRDCQSLPLRSIATDYHYLTCMKIGQSQSALDVPDSKQPGALRADLSLRDPKPLHVAAGQEFEVPVAITNAGDTLWLTGQTVRAGIVMPGVRIFDDSGEIVSERHGHPLLPRAIPPGQTVLLNVECLAPEKPGDYTVRIDLVAQHVCWFADRGSQPLIVNLKVEANT